jgi:pimeloyl-ACP methyl ester carboxylesterase
MAVKIKAVKIQSTVVALLFCGMLLVLTACGDSSSTGAVPRFESTACKHTLEAGSTTKCGYLIVPEDRNDAADTRTIRLYVTIFKSLTGDSSNPPLVYLTGGPGASTAAANQLFESTDASNYFRQDFGGVRDLIVLDQRGTNYSLPSLYCSDELDPLRSQVYGISYAEAAVLRIEALETCYDRLQDEGVDLSAYNSLQNAADVNDMVQSLGYDMYNIYSASYGTRLAMLTMKHYPDKIQSVVLDSILPPELNPYEQATVGMVYAFRFFFDAAATAYPDLETQFYEMVENLAANPVNVTGHHYDSGNNPTDDITVDVTGVKLVSFLVAELKMTPYDRNLPQKISSMYTSADYSLVADAWISFIDFFFSAGEAGSDAASIGMYNSIFGANDAYYTSPDKIEEIISDNVTDPSFAAYLQGAYIETEPAVQGLWPVDPISFRERDPVVSAIPTLMLVGALDTATPQIFSLPSAEFLSNSYYFAIPSGHATAYLPCVDQMIDDFVKDPQVAPTNTCAAGYQWN